MDTGLGKSSYHRMLETRPDWCISRQRLGVCRFHYLFTNNSGELHPDTLALMEKVAQRD